jgi:hypothetical protein
VHASFPERHKYLDPYTADFCHLLKPNLMQSNTVTPMQHNVIRPVDTAVGAAASGLLPWQSGQANSVIRGASDATRVLALIGNAPAAQKPQSIAAQQGTGSAATEVSHHFFVRFN